MSDYLDNTESAEASEVEEMSAKKPSKKSGLTKYRVLVGLSYGEKHVEIGDVVSDIPEESISWLLEGQYIEKVS